MADPPPFAVGDWVRIRHPNYAGQRLARIERVARDSYWPYTVHIQDHDRLCFGITNTHEIEPYTPTEDELDAWCLLILEEP